MEMEEQKNNNNTSAEESTDGEDVGAVSKIEGFIRKYFLEGQKLSGGLDREGDRAPPPDAE